MTYDEALNIINSSIAAIVTPTKHREADKAILDYASGLVNNTVFGPSWADGDDWSPSASSLYAKFASIAAFNEFDFLLLGEYGSLSETIGGLSWITGNSIISDTVANNTVKKTSADFGQFMRMRYNEGISFHTGIAGAIGTTFDDDYNMRFLIDNSGRILSFTDFCDNLGNVSISLSDRQGFDAAEVLSIDYDDRALWNSDGTDKVDYSGDSSSVLKLDSTTKGFTPPRMTSAQKNSISSPQEGTIVFDTALKKMCMYGATGWETITSV
jgi:hypothetical protein